MNSKNIVKKKIGFCSLAVDLCDLGEIFEIGTGKDLRIKWRKYKRGAI